jgi:hypothetical protein
MAMHGGALQVHEARAGHAIQTVANLTSPTCRIYIEFTLVSMYCKGYILRSARVAQLVRAQDC